MGFGGTGSGFVAPPSTGESVGGLVTLDLAGATESNTGQKGPNTSLGVVSRFEVSAVHGRPDSSLDAYMSAIGIGDRPSNTTGLRVVFTCSTPDPSPAIGASAGIGLFVGTAATPILNQGYVALIQVQNSPGPRYRGIGLNRIGTTNTGTTVLDNCSDAGSLHLDLVLYFDSGDVPEHAMVRSWSSAGVTNGVALRSQSSGLLSGTDIFIGLVGDQQGASPLDVLDMQDIVIQYEWLTNS